MSRARFLVWMIALVALVMPPGVTAHAVASVGQIASVECADHPPPPDCPEQGTAKHAGGTCCPLMTSAVAVVPPVAPADTSQSFQARPDPRIVHLNGLTYSKDPPPPRV
jgi:hypothetical protein